MVINFMVVGYYENGTKNDAKVATENQNFCCKICSGADVSRSILGWIWAVWERGKNHTFFAASPTGPKILKKSAQGQPKMPPAVTVIQRHTTFSGLS